MEMNPRQPLWRVPAAIVLFVISLPVGFALSFATLFVLIPDAGPAVVAFLLLTIVEGAPLPGAGKQECRAWAKTVLDKDGNLIGAWIEC